MKKIWSLYNTLLITSLLCCRAYSLSLPTPSGNNENNLSRRSALGRVALGILSQYQVSASLVPQPANAIEESKDDARSKLLQAIKGSRSDSEVLEAIDLLIPLNPAKQGSDETCRVDLDGEWKLIWSMNDDFSPLLRIPKPFKPDSYQYFGRAASIEVGEGRVAQGLTGGIFGTSQAWLSSGIEPTGTDDPYALEIEPPFRLQIGGRYLTGKAKTTIVEAQNDADFRKVNARSVEAQQAPKNIYKQLYVERNGKGSLRISKITDGDPVIVGAILIHEKL